MKPTTFLHVSGVNSSDFDVDVHLNIRRRVEAVTSRWQQCFVKINDDLDAWIDQHNGFFGNCRQNVNDW